MTARPTLDHLRRLLAEAPADVAAAYLFGSVARGTGSATSDVDLGLLLRCPPVSTLEGRVLDYEAELERAVGGPGGNVARNLSENFGSPPHGPLKRAASPRGI